MTERTGVSSPRLLARIAGVFYLFTGAAVFALFTRSKLIVRGDAAATAHNILGSEPLFRLAFAADLIAAAAYVGVTAILYILLKPVNRTLSLLAAFFGLAGCVIMAVNMVNHLAPLFLLGGDAYLSAFTTQQLQALALVALKLHGLGYNLSMAFFGFYCFFLGLLILGATFLPRMIGALLVLTGACYVTNSFAIFLSPALAAHLYPYILLPGLLGEGSLVAWLLLFGVNAAKWHEQAGTSGHTVRA